MYNIKTNSGRKENHKYNKPNLNKKRQNGSHYQYNKYNKYRPKYNNPDPFSKNSYEYDGNTLYKKDSKKIKKIKKKDLIEVDENYQLNAEDQEIKENSSSHENSTYDYQTQEKTVEKYDKINYNFSYNNFDDDKSLTNEQDLNSSENNTIIFPNRNSLGRTNSQYFSDDKENIDSNIITNSPNFLNLNNITNNNNCKENSSKIISSINLSTEDLKDAFYVPKKRNVLYDSNIYSNENLNFNNNIQQGNFLNEILTQNNSLQKGKQMNMFLNNNNNNYLFCNRKNSEPIRPFRAYDSYNFNSFNPKSSCDSLRSSAKSGSIIDISEKEKENTDILEIHVKISKKETIVFKIRRYDDMFKTVKMFCEINKLDIKLIRPLIIYIIKALNSIYGIYNLKLKRDEIEFLKDIKKEFYHEDNDSEEIRDDNLNNEEDSNYENDDRYFNMD